MTEEEVVEIEHISVEHIIAEGLMKSLKAGECRKFGVMMRLFSESSSKANRGTTDSR